MITDKRGRILMKSIPYLCSYLLLIFTIIKIDACPTCIGKIDKNMPPFFTQEYDEYLEHYDTNDQDQKNDDVRKSNESQT